MKKFEMLNIICQDCELTSKEKLVAQYFVYKSNKSGACYPSVETIAEQCSVSRRTVQRATKKLAEREYIVKSERYNLGKQTSNLYSFNFLLLEEMRREKEIEQEKQEVKVEGVPEEMEVIELGDWLNGEIVQELDEIEDIVAEDEENGIDLDELMIKDDWEVEENIPFQFQGKNEDNGNEILQSDVQLQVVGEQQSEKRQGKFETANVEGIILLFCLLSHKESERVEGNGKQKEVRRIVFIWENEAVMYTASRTIMGAFFPP